VTFPLAASALPQALPQSLTKYYRYHTVTHYPNHLCLYLAPMSSVDLVESVDLVTDQHMLLGDLPVPSLLLRNLFYFFRNYGAIKKVTFILLLPW
jgi:hypothetical protein